MLRKNLQTRFGGERENVEPLFFARSPKKGVRTDRRLGENGRKETDEHQSDRNRERKNIQHRIAGPIFLRGKSWEGRLWRGRDEERVKRYGARH